MKYHSDLKILFSKTNSFNETLQKDNTDEILNQENKINNGNNYKNWIKWIIFIFERIK